MDSPSRKKANIAVSTGIALVNALDFVTPIFLMEKVKNIKANEEPKTASSSNGTNAFGA